LALFRCQFSFRQDFAAHAGANYQKCATIEEEIPLVSPPRQRQPRWAVWLAKQISKQEEMMASKETYKWIGELKKIIAQQNGLEEYFDNYYFLARIGSNYFEYNFRWEPFRDLAGPLGIGDSSLPIFIISDAKPRRAPEQRKVVIPTPHYQLWVSPGLDVVSVAGMWLELLVDDQAFHTDFDHGPFDWFVRGLGISADQLSQKGRVLLKL
jgi:hypothetical protein